MNRLALKRKPGRPPTFSDPSELQNKILEFFKQAETDATFIPTITGLVLYCGFVDRASFYDMEKRPEFTHIIKNARSLIEAVYERRLHGANCAGSIFALKNFGWTDSAPENHFPAVIQIINYTDRPSSIVVNGASE